MVDLIEKVLSFQPENLLPGIEKLALLIWIGVVLVSFASVYTQRISLPARFIWMAVIFFLPFVGLLFYCGYCLSKQDFSFLESLLAVKELQKEKQQGRNLISDSSSRIEKVNQLPG